ncbi:MAG: hypothetical protein LBB41_00130 [Prevotellaceae bacterium]|nr:hypothetical protein [Prevotellaceae bacterium]
MGKTLAIFAVMHILQEGGLFISAQTNHSEDKVLIFGGKDDATFNNHRIVDGKGENIHFIYEQNKAKLLAKTCSHSQEDLEQQLYITAKKTYKEITYIPNRIVEKNTSLIFFTCNISAYAQGNLSPPYSFILLTQIF